MQCAILNDDLRHPYRILVFSSFFQEVAVRFVVDAHQRTKMAIAAAKQAKEAKDAKDAKDAKEKEAREKEAKDKAS